MAQVPHIRHLIDLVSSQDRPSQNLLREYLEVQNYNILLEDQRVEYLLKMYGPKVAERYAAVKDHTPGNIQIAIENQHGEDDAIRVIEYIASFDPSANHQYAQWLVIRWLKNGFLLEDLARAREYLEYFHRFKPRLEKKDINAYPNLPDLYNAIAPLLNQSETPVVSARDEKRQLQLRMSKPPEANIVFNDPQYRIVIPLTQEASCYWGENTQWCTAAANNNYFDSYNKQGPLYIILIKALNKRFQFQFGSGFYSSSFMDENDRPIDIGDFVREYPAIFHALGEKKFIPYIDKIGIAMFSPEATNMMTARQLEAAIKTMDDVRKVDPAVLRHMDPQVLGQIPMSEADLAEIPEEVKKTLEFQKGLVQPKAGHGAVSTSRVFLLPLLPEEYYRDHVTQLVPWIHDVLFVIPQNMVTPEVLEAAVSTQPRLFARFPEEWRSTALAHEAADRIFDKGGSMAYQELDNAIPEEWRDEYIMQKYWNNRIIHDKKLRLNEIPHSYWNERNIVRAFINHPNDMKDHVGVLTDDIVGQVVSAAVRNSHLGQATHLAYSDETIQAVPSQFRTHALLKAIQNYDNSKIANYTDKKHAVEDLQKKRGPVYRLFPSQFWDSLSTIHGIKEISTISDLNPELLKDAAVVSAFMIAHPDQVATVPDEDITDDVIKNLLKNESYNRPSKTAPILAELGERGLVPERILTNAADEAGMAYFNLKNTVALNNIPSSLRSLSVMKAFALKGRVAIKDLPEQLQTPEIIEARLETAPDEFPDAPEQYRTPEFIMKMAKKQIRIVPSIPTELRSEELLHYVLDYSHGYSPGNDYEKRTVASQSFDTFPKSAMSERNIAAALGHGLIKGDYSWYEKFPIPAVAVGLLKQKPDLYMDFPPGTLTDAIIADAAKVQPILLLFVDPAKITEEMAFNAITTIARQVAQFRRERYPHNNREEAKIYDHIPVAVFSKRIYKLVAGSIVPLKDIPTKLRDNETAVIAVRADPRNVLAITNPAAWMNKNMQTFDPKDEKWMTRSEKAGFIHTKRTGWVDVRTLPKEKLDTGYSVAVTEAKVNKRIYLFNPRDKFILFMYTNKDEVQFPYKFSETEADKLRPSLIEVARKYLKGFKIKALNDLFVYNINGNILGGNQLSKKVFKGIQYTAVSHGDGSRYEIFIRNKPLMVFEVTPGNRDMRGNVGGSSVGIERMIDYPRVLENMGDIGDWFEDKFRGRFSTYKFDWELRNIGIELKSRGDYNGIITKHKVGRVGDLVVYRSDDDPPRIGVYDLNKKERVASAKIKKDGGVSAIDTGSRWGGSNEGVEALLDRVAKYLKQSKNAIGNTTFDKD